MPKITAKTTVPYVFNQTEVALLNDILTKQFPEASPAEIATIIDQTLSQEVTLENAARSDCYKASASVRDLALKEAAKLPWPANAIAVGAAWSAYAAACAVCNTVISETVE